MTLTAFLILYAIPPAAFGVDADTNPLSTTIDLLDSLAAKISAEGDAEAKAYKEYFQWCSDVASHGKSDVTSGEAKRDKLEAIIVRTRTDIQASDSKIEDLAASISNDERELQEATAVRNKEAADFASSEAELVDAIDTIDRGVMVLQREMQRNPAAMMQMDTSNFDKLLKSLTTVIDAASFPLTDQKKLATLVQAQQSADADDDELGAPSSKAYKHTASNSILDVLEDLKEKAEGQLMDLRKAESNTKHNFQMLKQSLDEQISADTNDADSEKAAKASAQENKAVAEGDLVETTKDLENDKTSLATASSTCLTATRDHEATVKSRGDELTALKTAKKILSETSSGAVAHSYSFLQLAHQNAAALQLQTRVDLANAEIVSLLKRLAKENHSTALAQLASRIAATERYGAGAGIDPFVKVKQLLTDLVMKLEAEATGDLTEKSYCDEEISKSEAKKTELSSDISKLTTEMDVAAAASARLKGDVKDTQAMLAELASSQAEMSKIRSESHSDYMTAKSDLSLGLEGVRKALGILREYYGDAAAASAAMLQGSSNFADMMEQPALIQHPALPDQHDKNGAAGAKIVETLETVEGDFARDLAVEETAEADAEAEYQKTTLTNTNTKAMKEQDVKYKTKEYKSNDKTLTDLSGDKETSSMELDAVLEYYKKIRERCIAKPETYETRKNRREAEIRGLREALSILQGETVFTQRGGKKHRHHSTFLATL